MNVVHGICCLVLITLSISPSTVHAAVGPVNCTTIPTICATVRSTCASSSTCNVTDPNADEWGCTYGTGTVAVSTACTWGVTCASGLCVNTTGYTGSYCAGVLNQTFCDQNRCFGGYCDPFNITGTANTTHGCSVVKTGATACTSSINYTSVTAPCYSGCTCTGGAPTRTGATDSFCQNSWTCASSTATCTGNIDTYLQSFFRLQGKGDISVTGWPQNTGRTERISVLKNDIIANDPGRFRYGVQIIAAAGTALAIDGLPSFTNFSSELTSFYIYHLSNTSNPMHSVVDTYYSTYLSDLPPEDQVAIFTTDYTGFGHCMGMWAWTDEINGIDWFACLSGNRYAGSISATFGIHILWLEVWRRNETTGEYTRNTFLTRFSGTLLDTPLTSANDPIDPNILFAHNDTIYTMLGRMAITGGTIAGGIDSTTPCQIVTTWKYNTTSQQFELDRYYNDTGDCLVANVFMSYFAVYDQYGIYIGGNATASLSNIYVKENGGSGNVVYQFAYTNTIFTCLCTSKYGVIVVGVKASTVGSANFCPYKQANCLAIFNWDNNTQSLVLSQYVSRWPASNTLSDTRQYMACAVSDKLLVASRASSSLSTYSFENYPRVNSIAGSNQYVFGGCVEYDLAGNTPAPVFSSDGNPQGTVSPLDQYSFLTAGTGNGAMARTSGYCVDYLYGCNQGCGTNAVYSALTGVDCLSNFTITGNGTSCVVSSGQSGCYGFDCRMKLSTGSNLEQGCATFAGCDGYRGAVYSKPNPLGYCPSIIPDCTSRMCQTDGTCSAAVFNDSICGSSTCMTGSCVGNAVLSRNSTLISKIQMPDADSSLMPSSYTGQTANNFVIIDDWLITLSTQYNGSRTQGILLVYVVATQNPLTYSFFQAIEVTPAHYDFYTNQNALMGGGSQYVANNFYVFVNASSVTPRQTNCSFMIQFYGYNTTYNKFLSTGYWPFDNNWTCHNNASETCIVQGTSSYGAHNGFLVQCTNNGDFTWFWQVGTTVPCLTSNITTFSSAPITQITGFVYQGVVGTLYVSWKNNTHNQWQVWRFYQDSCEFRDTLGPFSSVFAVSGNASYQFAAGMPGACIAGNNTIYQYVAPNTSAIISGRTFMVRIGAAAYNLAIGISFSTTVALNITNTTQTSFSCAVPYFPSQSLTVANTNSITIGMGFGSNTGWVGVLQSFSFVATGARGNFFNTGAAYLQPSVAVQVKPMKSNYFSDVYVITNVQYTQGNVSIPADPPRGDALYIYSGYQAGTFGCNATYNDDVPCTGPYGTQNYTCDFGFCKAEVANSSYEFPLSKKRDPTVDDCIANETICSTFDFIDPVLGCVFVYNFSAGRGPDIDGYCETISCSSGEPISMGFDDDFCTGGSPIISAVCDPTSPSASPNGCVYGGLVTPRSLNCTVFPAICNITKAACGQVSGCVSTCNPNDTNADTYGCVTPFVAPCVFIPTTTACSINGYACASGRCGNGLTCQIHVNQSYCDTNRCLYGFCDPFNFTMSPSIDPASGCTETVTNNTSCLTKNTMMSTGTPCYSTCTCINGTAVKSGFNNSPCNSNSRQCTPNTTCQGNVDMFAQPFFAFNCWVGGGVTSYSTRSYQSASDVALIGDDILVNAPSLGRSSILGLSYYNRTQIVGQVQIYHIFNTTNPPHSENVGFITLRASDLPPADQTLFNTTNEPYNSAKFCTYIYAWTSTTSGREWIACTMGLSRSLFPPAPADVYPYYSAPFGLTIFERNSSSGAYSVNTVLTVASGTFPNFTLTGYDPPLGDIVAYDERIIMPLSYQAQYSIRNSSGVSCQFWTTFMFNGTGWQIERSYNDTGDCSSSSSSGAVPFIPFGGRPNQISLWGDIAIFQNNGNNLGWAVYNMSSALATPIQLQYFDYCLVAGTCASNPWYTTTNCISADGSILAIGVAGGASGINPTLYGCIRGPGVLLGLSWCMRIYSWNSTLSQYTFVGYADPYPYGTPTSSGLNLKNPMSCRIDDQQLVVVLLTNAASPPGSSNFYYFKAQDTSTGASPYGFIGWGSLAPNNVAVQQSGANILGAPYTPPPNIIMYGKYALSFISNVANLGSTFPTGTAICLDWEDGCTQGCGNQTTYFSSWSTAFSPVTCTDVGGYVGANNCSQTGRCSYFDCRGDGQNSGSNPQCGTFLACDTCQGGIYNIATDGTPCGYYSSGCAGYTCQSSVCTLTSLNNASCASAGGTCYNQTCVGWEANNITGKVIGQIDCPPLTSLSAVAAYEQKHWVSFRTGGVATIWANVYSNTSDRTYGQLSVYQPVGVATFNLRMSWVFGAARYDYIDYSLVTPITLTDGSFCVFTDRITASPYITTQCDVTTQCYELTPSFPSVPANVHYGFFNPSSWPCHTNSAYECSILGNADMFTAPGGTPFYVAQLVSCTSDNITNTMFAQIIRANNYVSITSYATVPITNYTTGDIIVTGFDMCTASSGSLRHFCMTYRTASTAFALRYTDNGSGVYTLANNVTFPFLVLNSTYSFSPGKPGMLYDYTNSYMVQHMLPVDGSNQYDNNYITAALITVPSFIISYISIPSSVIGTQVTSNQSVSWSLAHNQRTSVSFTELFVDNSGYTALYTAGTSSLTLYGVFGIYGHSTDAFEPNIMSNIFYTTDATNGTYASSLLISNVFIGNSTYNTTYPKSDKIIIYATNPGSNNECGFVFNDNATCNDNLQGTNGTQCFTGMCRAPSDDMIYTNPTQCNLANPPCIDYEDVTPCHGCEYNITYVSGSYTLAAGFCQAVTCVNGVPSFGSTNSSVCADVCAVKVCNMTSPDRDSHGCVTLSVSPNGTACGVGPYGCGDSICMGGECVVVVIAVDQGVNVTTGVPVTVDLTVGNSDVENCTIINTGGFVGTITPSGIGNCNITLEYEDCANTIYTMTYLIYSSLYTNSCANGTLTVNATSFDGVSCNNTTPGCGGSFCVSQNCTVVVTAIDKNATLAAFSTITVDLAAGNIGVENCTILNPEIYPGNISYSGVGDCNVTFTYDFCSSNDYIFTYQILNSTYLACANGTLNLNVTGATGTQCNQTQPGCGPYVCLDNACTQVVSAVTETANLDSFQTTTVDLHTGNFGVSNCSILSTGGFPGTITLSGAGNCTVNITSTSCEAGLYNITYQTINSTFATACDNGTLEVNVTSVDCTICTEPDIYGCGSATCLGGMCIRMVNVTNHTTSLIGFTSTTVDLAAGGSGISFCEIISTDGFPGLLSLSGVNNCTLNITSTNCTYGTYNIVYSGVNTTCSTCSAGIVAATINNTDNLPCGTPIGGCDSFACENQACVSILSAPNITVYMHAFTNASADLSQGANITSCSITSYGDFPGVITPTSGDGCDISINYDFCSTGNFTAFYSVSNNITNTCANGTLFINVDVDQCVPCMPPSGGCAPYACVGGSCIEVVTAIPQTLNLTSFSGSIDLATGNTGVSSCTVLNPGVFPGTLNYSGPGNCNVTATVDDCTAGTYNLVYSTTNSTCNNCANGTFTINVDIPDGTFCNATGICSSTSCINGTCTEIVTAIPKFVDITSFTNFTVDLALGNIGVSSCSIIDYDGFNGTASLSGGNNCTATFSYPVCGIQSFNMVYQTVNSTYGNCANGSLTVDVNLGSGTICNSTGTGCDSSLCLGGTCTQTISAVNTTVDITSFAPVSVNLAAINVGVANCTVLNQGSFPGTITPSGFGGCDIQFAVSNCTLGVYQLPYVVYNDTYGTCANGTITVNVSLPDGAFCDPASLTCTASSCVAGSCVLEVTAINKTLDVSGSGSAMVDLKIGNINVTSCVLYSTGGFPGIVSQSGPDGCIITAAASNCSGDGIYIATYGTFNSLYGNCANGSLAINLTITDGTPCGSNGFCSPSVCIDGNCTQTVSAITKSVNVTDFSNFTVDLANGNIGVSSCSIYDYGGFNGTLTLSGGNNCTATVSYPYCGVYNFNLTYETQNSTYGNCALGEFDINVNISSGTICNSTGTGCDSMICVGEQCITSITAVNTTVNITTFAVYTVNLMTLNTGVSNCTVLNQGSFPGVITPGDSGGCTVDFSVTNCTAGTYQLPYVVYNSTYNTCANGTITVIVNITNGAFCNPASLTCTASSCVDGNCTLEVTAIDKELNVTGLAPISVDLTTGNIGVSTCTLVNPGAYPGTLFQSGVGGCNITASVTNCTVSGIYNVTYTATNSLYGNCANGTITLNVNVTSGTPCGSGGVCNPSVCIAGNCTAAVSAITKSVNITDFNNVTVDLASGNIGVTTCSIYSYGGFNGTITLSGGNNCTATLSYPVCGTQTFNITYQTYNSTYNACALGELDVYVDIAAGTICNTTGTGCDSQVCIGGQCVTTITATNANVSLTSFTPQTVDLQSINTGVTNCTVLNQGTFPGTISTGGTGGCNVTFSVPNCTAGVYQLPYLVYNGTYNTCANGTITVTVNITNGAFCDPASLTCTASSCVDGTCVLEVTAITKQLNITTFSNSSVDLNVGNINVTTCTLVNPGVFPGTISQSGVGGCNITASVSNCSADGTYNVTYTTTNSVYGNCANGSLIITVDIPDGTPCGANTTCMPTVCIGNNCTTVVTAITKSAIITNFTNVVVDLASGNTGVSSCSLVSLGGFNGTISLSGGNNCTATLSYPVCGTQTYNITYQTTNSTYGVCAEGTLIVDINIAAGTICNTTGSGCDSQVCLGGQCVTSITANNATVNITSFAPQNLDLISINTGVTNCTVLNQGSFPGTISTGGSGNCTVTFSVSNCTAGTYQLPYVVYNSTYNTCGNGTITVNVNITNGAFCNPASVTCTASSCIDGTCVLEVTAIPKSLNVTGFGNNSVDLTIGNINVTTCTLVNPGVFPGTLSQSGAGGCNISAAVSNCSADGVYNVTYTTTNSVYGNCENGSLIITVNITTGTPCGTVVGGCAPAICISSNCTTVVTAINKGLNMTVYTNATLDLSAGNTGVTNCSLGNTSAFPGNVTQSPAGNCTIQFDSTSCTTGLFNFNYTTYNGTYNVCAFGNITVNITSGGPCVACNPTGAACNPFVCVADSCTQIVTANNVTTNITAFSSSNTYNLATGNTGVSTCTITSLGSFPGSISQSGAGGCVLNITYNSCVQSNYTIQYSTSNATCSVCANGTLTLVVGNTTGIACNGTGPGCSDSTCIAGACVVFVTAINKTASVVVFENVTVDLAAGNTGVSSCSIISTGGFNGTVSLSGIGNCNATFTSTSCMVANYSVQYSVTNSTYGNCANGTLFLSVVAATPVTVRDDSVSVASCSSVILDQLANDTNVYPPTVSINGCGGFPCVLSWGTVNVTANYTFGITPFNTTTGIFTFVYRACDNTSCNNCGNATVTVSVSPLAVNDSASAVTSNPAIANVTTNDCGNITNCSILSESPALPVGWVLNITSAPGCVMTLAGPVCGVFGTTAQYQICGPDSLCSTAYISISVINSTSPTTQNDTLAVPYDTPVTIDVLSGATPPYDPSTLAVVVPPAHGNITQVNTTAGTITYLPDTGYKGLDSFVFELCDQAARCLCYNSTVRIIIASPSPIALVPLCFQTYENSTPVTGDIVTPQPYVMDPASFLIIIPASFGTVTYNSSTGIISYQPFSPTFTGVDEILYSMCTFSSPIQCGYTTVCFLVIPLPVPIPIAPCAGPQLEVTGSSQCV